MGKATVLHAQNRAAGWGNACMYEKRKLSQILMSLMLCLGILFLGKACFVYRQQISTLFYKQLKSGILSSQTPVFGYISNAQDQSGGSVYDAGKRLAQQTVPIYQYALGYPQTAMSREDRELMQQLILSEGRDENTNYSGDAADDGANMTAEEIQETEAESAASDSPSDAVDEAQQSELSDTTFIYNTSKVNEIALEPLRDFETLMSGYYVLDSTTMIDETQLNVDKLLAYDMHLQTGNENPQILIYHTHSQEAFVDSDPSDPSTTIVGAGEKLAQLLRGYGFNVIHHTGQYDVASRDYAYSNAAPAVEQILAENPSIEVIIDLHRDGVAEGTHIVTQIGGKQMAQFMFFNGLSRTKARGNIDYLYNEHIDENLAFSFQAQLVANEYYPGLARKIYLKGYRYNMHYRGKSLLIELGAQTNTVEEIMNAVDPLAHILKITLTGEE